MGNYRDKLDIIAEILQVASHEARKTQIMYQANLSYKVLQRYLIEVTEASLLRFEDTKQSYIITDKGQEYLTAYKDYLKANKSIEKRLSEFSLKRKFLQDLCLDDTELEQPQEIT